MQKIKRVGVTFPPELLKDFDNVIEAIGYENRSKAVQDAVRMFVAERKPLQEGTQNQAGFLVMLYNHEVEGLENAVTHVQHDFTRIICSMMHVHLNETDCLEAIAVEGKADDIRGLRNELAPKRGVKLLKVVVFPI